MISQERIFSVTDSNFNEIALDIFRYQAACNPVYRQFVELMGIIPSKVTHFTEIPFLPIELFKSHKVLIDSLSVSKIFESSSTTGIGISRHYIHDLNFCRDSFSKCFHHFYGSPEDCVFIALLPGYTERETSSLVFMVKHLMEASGRKQECLFTTDLEILAKALKKHKATSQKVILIGVTWALMDFATQHPMSLSENIIIMETGGMKGRKKELTRAEVHDFLKHTFGVSQVHSEYGMTELQSAAYSLTNGMFRCPPWMTVAIGDTSDPLQFEETGKTGNLRIIDLANLYSCSFIATSDLGKKNADGSFEVLGRTDNSDIRGCSLMMTSKEEKGVLMKPKKNKSLLNAQLVLSFCFRLASFQKFRLPKFK